MRRRRLAVTAGVATVALACSLSSTAAAPGTPRDAALGASGFGRSSVIGPASPGTGAPAVAVNAAGDAVVSWANAPAPDALFVRRLSFTAGLARPERLDGLAQFPLAAATDDLAIVAWAQGRTGAETIRYAVAAGGAAFSTPRTLGVDSTSPSGSWADARSAALAGAGTHAVLAWNSGRSIRAALLDG